MKIPRLLLRLFLYLAGGLLALIFAFLIYCIIPRSIGEVRVDGVSSAPGSVAERLDMDLPWDVHPNHWLRIQLSSTGDLNARAAAVSGGEEKLYAWSNFCPLRDPLNNHLMTRGPFPDDMPEFLPHRDIMLPPSHPGQYAAEVVGGGYRHADKMADGRFHYTVYIDADHLDYGNRDLCLQITSTAFFSPHAESRVITIPAAMMRQTLPRLTPPPTISRPRQDRR